PRLGRRQAGLLGQCDDLGCNRADRARDSLDDVIGNREVKTALAAEMVVDGGDVGGRRGSDGPDVGALATDPAEMIETGLEQLGAGIGLQLLVHTIDLNNRLNKSSCCGKAAGPADQIEEATRTVWTGQPREPGNAADPVPRGFWGYASNFIE